MTYYKVAAAFCVSGWAPRIVSESELIGTIREGIQQSTIAAVTVTIVERPTG